MPEPPHRALRFDLESAVGPENFAEFVASAFGRSAMVPVPTDQGKTVVEEQPVIDGRLASYGLEDPFMWLAKRREELLLARVECASTHSNPGSSGSLLKVSSEMLKSIVRLIAWSVAGDSPTVQSRLTEYRTRVRKARTVQVTLGLTSLLAVALLSVFTGVNVWNLTVDRRAYAAISHLPESLAPTKAIGEPTTRDDRDRISGPGRPLPR